jgi:hypothetical protein
LDGRYFFPVPVLPVFFWVLQWPVPHAAHRSRWEIAYLLNHAVAHRHAIAANSISMQTGALPPGCVFDSFRLRVSDGEGKFDRMMLYPAPQ